MEKYNFYNHIHNLDNKSELCWKVFLRMDI